MADENAGAGSARDAERQLYRLREKLRQAKSDITAKDAEIERLKREQPGEGSQAITAADAELLTRYKALGTPEALQKAQEDAQTAANDLKKRDRKDSVLALAKQAGVDGEALWQLAEGRASDELEVEEKDGKSTLHVKRDGKRLTPEEAFGPLARALSPTPTTPAPERILPRQRSPQGSAQRVTDDEIDADIQKRHGVSL